MSSKSQASYVARLSKAEQLHEYLVNFDNYTSSNETLTKEALETLITSLHNIQNEYTQTQNDYLLATEQRKKSFEKEENSIDKLLSPIGSYLKASLNKEARFYQEVNSLINKIRGNSTNNNTESSISSSEKSYGSRLQNFKDYYINTRIRRPIPTSKRKHSITSIRNIIYPSISQ